MKTARSQEFLITLVAIGFAVGFSNWDDQRMDLSIKIGIALLGVVAIILNFRGRGQRFISTDGKVLILKNGDSIRQFDSTDLDRYQIRKKSDYRLIVFLKDGEEVSMSLSFFESERSVRRIFRELGIPENASSEKPAQTSPE